MDLNALMGTLLSEESIQNLGKKTGATDAEVRGVLGNALPLLLNGAGAQAADEATSAGFAGALQQHAQSNTSVLSSFLGGVDLEDGAKIVAHLLGAGTQSQTQSVAASTGVSAAKTGSILAAVAPLLMSLIGQQAGSEANSGLNTAGLMGNLLNSGDMTGLLGSLLGGNSASAPAQTAAPAAQKTGLLGKLLGLLK